MNLPNVSKEIRTWVESQIGGKKQPQNIRASMIGDPCARYIYHAIVDWDKAKAVDPELQGVFELGSHLEELGLKFLKSAGFNVRQPDNRYWNQKGISGRSDFSLSREDIPIKHFPAEIKFLGEYADRITSWQDMIKSDRRWVRRYAGQLLTYMLLHDKELGLFIAFSKTTAVIWGKDDFHIWFNFDEDMALLEYAEFLLKRSEEIWKHIKANDPPERIDPKERLCIDCDFVTTCLPPMYFGPEAKILDDQNLLQMLLRKDELAPFNSEYQKIQKDLKTAFDHIESAVVGPYLISGKEVERKGYTIDPTTYWDWRSKKIEPKKE